jgi:hypothetical protein
LEFDLKVKNFLNTLVVMGDLGAQTLLYFWQLEFQIQLKRQIDHAVETNRHIDMGQYQTQLMKDFEAGILTTQLLQEWKLNLEQLVEELEDKEAIGKTLSYVLERETWAMQGELINGHYIYMLDKTLTRLKQTLDKLSSDLNP